MPGSRMWILCFSCLSLLGATAQSPGVVFEIDVTDHVTGRKGTVTWSAEGVGSHPYYFKARVDWGSDGRVDAEVRYDGVDMVVINHEEQFAAVATKDDLSEIRPPRRRAQFRMTEEQTRIAGSTATKGEVLAHGRVVQGLWVTDWDNLTGGTEMKGVLGEVGPLIHAFNTGSTTHFPPSLQPAVLGILQAGDPARILQTGDPARVLGCCFPSRSIRYDASGEAVSEAVLAKARQVRLDVGEFAARAPDGYKTERWSR